MVIHFLKLEAIISGQSPDTSRDVSSEWFGRPNLQYSSRVERDTTHLCYLETLDIAPTKGLVTIAGAQAVFADIDTDFLRLGTNRCGFDTGKARISVLEMADDGDYQTLLGSFGVDPRFLCLTQGQIVEFCQTYSQYLEQEGSALLFVFQVDGRLIVTTVYVYQGKLRVNVSPLEDKFVWSVDPRLKVVVLVPN